METISSKPDQQQYIYAITAVILSLATLYVFFIRKRNSDIRTSVKSPNTQTLQICASLKAKFPDFTQDRSDPQLWSYLKTYWAAQARAPTPALIVRPRDVAQVAKVIGLLAESVKRASSLEPVHFAIRSGGHSPVQGFANIDEGIVLDLSLLQEVTLSADRKFVTIGPGATWGTVYRKLESYGLAVAGGRASSVGVGGLTLGGGLSFFSPQVGFVCDAVESFEVVLADGSIVTADAKTPYSDLAIALRGGGNNFGVVTGFTARTFPQTNVWMGYCFHYPSAVERLIEAYYAFGKPESFDKKATCMFILSWAPYLPFYLPITCLNYAEPTPHPPALRRFSNEKRFWSSLGVRTLAKATDVVESMSPANKQDLFHTTTFENNLEVLHEAHNAFKDSLAGIKKVSGMVWSLVFQPLVPSATLHHESNAMGINTDKTLTVMHVSVVWNSAKDAATVHRVADELISRVERFSRELGVFHPYKYANYCSVSQNPYAGYGPDRQKFLQEVSRKFDPHGVFQNGVPGGHKLWID